VSAQSVDGNPVFVSFSAPSVSGGEAPVTTSCVPGAGSTFPVGSTSVTCTARDARRQTVSCDFAVTVTRVPRLAATRFVSFGDSITEGVVSTCARTTRFMTFAQTMLVLPQAANDPWAYPNVLQSRLRSAYLAQQPSVANRGVGGEELATGVSRLPGVLVAESPQVLLLLEGANDVNQNRPPATIASALRTMVRDARGRGIQVYLGTLLPQRPLGVEGSCRGFGAGNVVPANDQIRGLAAAEGAVLVDLFQAFGGVPGTLIGPDGLHPSEAGYQRIAEAFYDAIRLRLED
jgi:lysophospholipase L1-like esterase